MAMSCEKIRNLLESFYDNELHGKKHDAVSEHLHQCEGCSNELRKLERTGELLRSHFEGVAASEDLSGMWQRVDMATEASTGYEAESLRDRLVRIFAIPRPAWAAVGVAAVVLVLLLAYLPGNHSPTLAANDCIIDSVEAEDSAIA